ncbi:unnamed protein product [[Candida] boidinii]|nr:unnamed protein product [[Candida] boidinii]
MNSGINDNLNTNADGKATTSNINGSNKTNGVINPDEIDKPESNYAYDDISKTADVTRAKSDVDKGEEDENDEDDENDETESKSKEKSEC